MTFNTGNNVPSTDPRDLYDNAENLDKLVNGADPFYADRKGVLRESWAGMENSFTNAQEGRETAFTLSQADKESRFQAFLVSSGYVSKGDYAAGVALDERNEYVAVDAATTGTTAGLYRPGPGATLPLTLTGTWATDSANLVLLGDDVLRQELADADQGASMLGRSLFVVESVEALLAVPRRADQLVQLRGYHPGTRKGGGKPRYWDSARSKADHNGGTVIDPDKGFPADWSILEDVQAWFTAATTGTGCWVMQENGGVFLPTEFGAKGDGVTNDQPAYWACCEAGGDGATIIFTPTDTAYRMHWFFGFDNQQVIAYGARIDIFKLSPTTGPTVLAASGNNARYDGVWLNCLETNLPNVRTTFEDRYNAHWYKCRFEGFRDAREPNLNTAWGAYMKRASNITLEHCQFENNSQNDIAVLEGCKNINIISPYGSALDINLEPNSETPSMRCVTITNAVIEKLLVQENTLVGDSVNNVLVQACDVQNLYYDGAGIEFEGSRIKLIHPMPDGVGRCYAGALKLNGAVAVGANLLRDPNFVSVSQNDAGSSWQVYTGTVSPGSRYAGISAAIGRALRMNPTNVSGTNSLRSESVSVTAGSKYLVAAMTGANYPDGAGQVGIQLGVRWLDGAGAELSITICPVNRAPVPVGTTSSAPVGLKSAVVVAPTGAVSAQLLIGSTLSSATTSSSDWYSVGLHPIVEGSSGAGMPDPYPAHQAVRGNLRGVGASIPSSSPTQYYYRNYSVGDRIINPAPVAGGYEGWVCTTAGTPGTWKGYGLIAA